MGGLILKGIRRLLSDKKLINHPRAAGRDPPPPQLSDISINHPGSRRFRTQRVSWTDANRPPVSDGIFFFLSVK